MADISILKPQAGEHSVFEQSEGSRLIFNFPTDQAVMERVGDNLVFTFDDASTITLNNFYTAYTKATLPEFVVDGQTIAGEQFFAALGEDLQPAAGPAAGPTAVPGAGSSAGFGDPSLLGGIDRLGGLDIGFTDESEQTDTLNGFPDATAGAVTPAVDTAPAPTPIPPLASTPTPTPPLTPTPIPNAAPVINGFTVENSSAVEAGVFVGGNEANPGVPVVMGQVLATDPEGDTLTYGFINAAGERVSSITTPYGTITMGPDGTYTYTLNNEASNNLAMGENALENFTVYVSDSAGNTTVAPAPIVVNVVGTNDVPTLGLTVPQIDMVEGGNSGTEATDTTISGVAEGADVDTGAQLHYSFGTDSEGNPILSLEDPNGYGTLNINPNTGEYTYTLHNEAAQNLDADATFTQQVTVHVTDEHGAHSEQELLINVQGRNDAPVITATSVTELRVTESGVQADPNNGNNPNAQFDGKAADFTGQLKATDADSKDGMASEGAERPLLFSFTAVDGVTIIAGTNPDGNPTQSITTEYGTLTLDTVTGTYSFTLNNNSTATNALNQGDSTALSFGVTVTDAQNASNTNAVNLVVNIQGTNDRPELSVSATEFTINAASQTGEGNKPTSSVEGTFTVLDQDADGNSQDFTITNQENSNLFSTNNPDGTVSITTEYGMLIINPNTGDNREGSYTYTLDNNADVLKNLSVGETRTQTFTITTTDQHGANHSQTITITITGGNDAPSISGSKVLNVSESGVSTGGNTLFEGKVHDAGNANDAVTDVDNDGANGRTFTLTMGDGTASAGTPLYVLATVNMDGTYTYTTTNTQPAGNAYIGTLTITDDGSYSFNLNNANSIVQSLTPNDTLTLDGINVQVTDQHGAVGSGEYNLTVNIQGTNDRPQLQLFDGAGKPIGQDGMAHMELVEDASNNTVQGTFTVVDVDADGAKQTLSIAGGKTGPDTTTGTGTPSGEGASATFTTDYGTLTVNPDGTYSYTLNNDSEAVQKLSVGQPKFETFTITTTDAHGANHTQTIIIQITGSNDQPILTPKDGNLVVTESGVITGGNNWNNGQYLETDTGKADVTDVDGDTLVFSLKVGSVEVGQGQNLFVIPILDANGNLTYNTDGSLQFTVQTNYPGTDSDGSPIRLGTLKVAPDGTYSFQLDNNNKHTQGLNPGDTINLSGIELHVKDYTGSENSAAADHQDITVTIKGTNDRPSITLDGKDPSGTITHSVNDTVDINDATADHFYSDKADVSGTLQVKDVDLGDNKTYSITYGNNTYTAGTITDNSDGSRTIAFDTVYGKITFTIDGHGKITYEFSLDTGYDGKVHTLPAGTSANENFTLNVVDKWGASDSQNITITINGDNDKPWVGNDQQPSWVIDQIVEDSGNEIHTPQGGRDDVDHGKTIGFDGKLQATDIDGKPGDLQFSFVNEGKDSAENLRTMTHTDADGNEIGYITLNPDGSYSYTLFNDSPIVQALGKNDTLTGTFTVRVVDANGGVTYKDITITVNGTNDIPLVSGGSSDVFEDGGLVVPPAGAGDPTVNGKVNVNDVDTTEDQYMLFTGPRDANGMLIRGEHLGFTITPNYDGAGQLVSTTFVGMYGTLVLNIDGSYTYTLTANDAMQGTHQDAIFAKEQFPISVTTDTNHDVDHNGTANSAGNTVDSTITITIKGTNDAPELTTEDKVQGNPDHVLTDNVQLVTAATLTGTIHATDIDVEGDHSDTDSLTFHFMNRYDAQGKDIANGTFTDTTGQEKPGAPDADHWQPEQSTTGTYGSITINPDGTYSYTLDMFSDAVKNFDGDTIKETFYVTVTDHLGATHTKELVIEIPKPQYDGSGSSGGGQGNHHLEINGVTATDIGVIEDTTVTHKGQVTVDGSCCSVDGNGDHHPHTPQGEGNGHADAGNLFFAFMVDGKLTQTVSDKYGSITIDPITGEYSYTLNNASTYVQELPEGYKVGSNFEVHLVDGDGTVRNETVTINTTITGTNDAPIVDVLDAINVTDGGTLVDDANHVTSHDIDIDQNTNQQQHLDYTFTYNGQAIQPGASVTTAYGTFTLNTDGTYKYVLNADSQAVNTLGQDEKIHDAGFKVTVSDGTSEVTKDISITINGTNDAPTLTVQNMAHGHMLTEDASTAMLTGKLLGQDIDAHDKLTYNMHLANDAGQPTGSGSSYILTGKFGTMVLDPSTGEYKYMLDNERESVQKLGQTEHATETFVFTVSDGKGGTMSQNVTITINGADDAAKITLSQDALAVMENDSTMGKPVAFGQVDIVDRDTNDTQSLTLKHGDGTSEQIIYKGTGSTSIAGEHGTLTLNADGTYTYTLTDHSLGKGVNDTDSFTIMVKEYDFSGNVIRETPHEINVNLTGTNDVPVVTLNTLQEHSLIENGESLTATGHITATDVDAGDTLTYFFVNASGEHVSTINTTYGTVTINQQTGEYTYTLNNGDKLYEGQNVTENFKVYAKDQTGAVAKDSQEVQVNLTGTNDAPVITGSETLAYDAAQHTLTGHVTATDVDVLASGVHQVLTYTFAYKGLELQPEAGKTAGSVETEHGTFHYNTADGTYSYTLNDTAQGSHVTDNSFSVIASDGMDSSTTHNLTIDIAADSNHPDATAPNALFSADDDSGLFFSPSPVEQYSTKASVPNTESDTTLFGAESHTPGHDAATDTPEGLSGGIFAETHTVVTDDTSNLGVDSPVTYDGVFGADQNLDVYAPPADGADTAWYGSTPDASEEALQLMVAQLSQSNNG